MKQLYFIILSHLLALSVFSQYYPPAIEWQKSFGTSGEDLFKSVIPTLDGGYIAAGSTNGNNFNVNDNHGGFDALVVKYSSNGAVEWKKCYGGTSDEHANKILQTADGGYIIVGDASSKDGDLSTNQGFNDAWIFKISSIGLLAWQKSYGSTGGDSFNGIQLTPDGGYIAAGGCGADNGDVIGSGYKGGGQDVWVVKMGSTGLIEWKSAYGSTQADIASDVENTSDGSYIVVGNTVGNDGDVSGHHSGTFDNLDIWVLKITKIGLKQWQKCLGGGTSRTPNTSAANDEAFSIKQTEDGGYVIAGYTSSVDGDVINSKGGETDGWIIKLAITGEIDWQQTIGGTSSDYLYDVVKHPDGGFVFCGSTASSDGDLTGIPNRGSGDCWVLKSNQSGMIQWTKNISSSGVDNARSLALTQGEGFIVGGWVSKNDFDAAGNMPTNGSFTDAWIIKLSSQVLPVTLLKTAAYYLNNGVIIDWQTTKEVLFKGFDIERSSDGITFYKMAFIPSQHSMASIADYSFIDKYLPVNAVSFYYRLKLVDKDGSYVFSKIMQVTVPDKLRAINFYPNPYSKGRLYTTKPVNNFKLYALSGTLVFSSNCFACTSFALPSLSPGSYLVKMWTGQDNQTQLLIIQP